MADIKETDVCNRLCGMMPNRSRLRTALTVGLVTAKVKDTNANHQDSTGPASVA